MRLRDPGPVGEVAGIGRPVEVQEAPYRIGGRRAAAGLAEHVPALRVERAPAFTPP